MVRVHGGQGLRQSIHECPARPDSDSANPRRRFQLRLHRRPRYRKGRYSVSRDRASGGESPIELNFAPYESRLLVFSDHAAPPSHPRGGGDALDISSDWRVEFPALKRSIEMHELRSWTDDDATKFFSGQATYEKTVS